MHVYFSILVTYHAIKGAQSTAAIATDDKTSENKITGVKTTGDPQRKARSHTYTSADCLEDPYSLEEKNLTQSS